MDSLGTFFREAREAQDLTFEQVAASTRIQETYLQALEEEHFSALPEKVFTKGFVRTYARTLGLDEEEALRRFSAAAGSFYQKEEEEQQQVLQREEDDRKGKANRNAVIILTGVILIGLIFILPREQSSPPPSPTTTQKTETAIETTIQASEPTTKVSSEFQTDQDMVSGTEAPTPLETVEEVPPQVATIAEAEPTIPVTPQDSSEPEEVGAAIQGTSPTEPPTRMVSPFEPKMGVQDGPLMLELEALEITWVVVRSDEREPHEALLQPGERALWRAHDRFLLTLGNAGGVKVTLNGEPRGPFGERGTVIRDLEIKP